MTSDQTMADECKDCVAYVELSKQDGGLGICDCVRSSHNQHVIGHLHPACRDFELRPELNHDPANAKGVKDEAKNSTSKD